jgi:phage terminase large subunit-like protein
VICDELHAWSKPSQRKTWAALVSGDATRDRVQTFTITTAGEANERDTGILGPMIDGNERDGELERDTRWALTISRNRESGTLIWNFSAQTEDPNDVAALKRANPASWISTDYLARKSASPELSDAEVLQLHGCVWAEGLRTWIPAEAWERCYEAGAEIPQDASVYVGVDIALVRDSTAVSVAWKRPEDERIVVETHVWAARAGTVAHEQPHGPVIKVSAIEEHLLALTSRYAVQEVLYDKRYFERSAEDLSDAGLTMVVLEQNSAPMADAYQDWFAGCMEGKVVHGGDKVLTAHVMATAAQKTDRGWRVSKIKQSHKIDGCVASVMAHYGAAHGVVADWGVLT